MQEPSAVHSTFTIERSYPSTPERVFAAFADPGKKRRWFAESDHHSVEHYVMDFRVGGQESARFRFTEGTPLKGRVLTNDTTYLDIVPDRRLVYCYTMAMDGKCFSASMVTVELLDSEPGTTLILTHQGAFFEGADGPDMREAGWRKLLGQLAGEFAR